MLAREIAEIMAGEEADDIERLWHNAWWALHYGGRGGPTVLALSALDIALWDLKARRADLPLWRLLGGFDPRVPCYAGGIDLDLSARRASAADRRQSRQGLPRHQDEGRPRRTSHEDVERVQAMREHLGDGFPLMADANMKWTVDEAIRAARALATLRPHLAGRADHSRRCRRPRPHHARGRRADRGRREPAHHSGSSSSYIAAGGVSYPEPDVTNCGGVTAFMKIARLAEAFNLPVTSHGAHDVTVHLLAACPNRSYLEAHGFGLDRYIADPLRIEDGFAWRRAARPRHRLRLEGPRPHPRLKRIPPRA